MIEIFFFLQSCWLVTWKTSEEFIWPNYYFKTQSKEAKEKNNTKSNTRQSE